MRVSRDWRCDAWRCGGPSDQVGVEGLDRGHGEHTGADAFARQQVGGLNATPDHAARPDDRHVATGADSRALADAHWIIEVRLQTISCARLGEDTLRVSRFRLKLAAQVARIAIWQMSLLLIPWTPASCSN